MAASEPAKANQGKRTQTKPVRNQTKQTKPVRNQTKQTKHKFASSS